MFGDLDNFSFPADSLGNFPGFDNDAFQQLQEHMQNFGNPNYFSVPDGADNFERYENALRDQLRKDGYLKQNETIRSMEWSDDIFKVNGKDIKPADRRKYMDLHDRYIGTSKYSGRKE
jgi:hypothetical protein